MPVIPFHTRWQGGLRVPVLVAVPALLSAGPAAAHPHVWITSVTTFVFEGREVAALRHHWRFDEFFSSYVIEQHDADGDARFNATELASVRDEAFSNLEEYNYFTHVRTGGTPLRLRQVEDFAARIDDGVLVYEFTLPLPEPLDPAASGLAVGVYDEEYYVEVLLDPQDPVRFDGLPDGTCIFDIREDALHAIYYGMVHPLAITLSCANS